MILFNLILEFERIEKYEQKYEFAGRFFEPGEKRKNCRDDFSDQRISI